MKKLLNLTLITLAIGAIVITGCKKYEEGPAFSLASKKGRLVNTWKFEKVFENDIEVPDSIFNYWFVNMVIDLKKDNTYSWTDGVDTENGTWDFGDKKETILMTANGESEADTMEIVRLKSSELWLKETSSDDVSEYHLIPK